MVYLIYGQQSVMIKNRLNKIIKERLDFVDSLNLVKFDMTQTLIQDVVLEASYMPLGYEHKVIVLEDCAFLKATKVKIKKDENDFSTFIKYLKNPNEDCDLILTLNEETIDQKSDIFKFILENGKVFQLMNVNKKDWNAYIYKYFTENLKVKIDSDAVNELAIRVNGDLNTFINEANKLCLYSDHITYEDVCKLVNKPLEENAFELFNHLMNKNNSQALQLYKDLLVNNVEPITLISMLSNQFRLLWQIAYLNSLNLSTLEIADKLAIKEIRVKILKKYMYSMSMNDLMLTLDELYLLDYKIKSGLVDRFIGFELFLINFEIK